MTRQERRPAGQRPPALLCMRDGLAPQIFDGAALDRLTEAYDVDLDRAPVVDFDDVDDRTLADVRLLVTGWGSPRIDGRVLDRAPRLEAVIHAAGSVKSHVGLECWDRGVQVSSAADVNAIPVAEYVTAMVLLAAKQVFQHQLLYRTRRSALDPVTDFRGSGAYRRPVGIVGASRIGRRVLHALSRTDLDLRLYDPTLSEDEAAALGARSMDLPDLLAECDVVSLHAPLLPSTRHLLDEQALSLLPDGATLINTARAGLVDAAALERALVSGRLWAVLDVTDPFEPLPASSPLYDLPNVVLTPHLAGSVGNELLRLGDHVVDEALRLADGRPLRGLVSRAELESMA